MNGYYYNCIYTYSHGNKSGGSQLQINAAKKFMSYTALLEV